MESNDRNEKNNKKRLLKQSYNIKLTFNNNNIKLRVTNSKGGVLLWKKREF